MRRSYTRHIQKDLLILVGSVIVAVFLVKLDILGAFLEATAGVKIFASIIGGAFFTSVLTVAPATVALIAVSKTFSPVAVALFGACGAVAVDFLIIRFVRDDVSRDIAGLMRPTLRRRLLSLFHVGFLKWVALAAGAFLIASPLPDEAGLILLGLSRVRERYLLPLTFVLHFGGIFALVTIASAVL